MADSIPTLLAAGARQGLRTVAFWAAVALPFVYLPPLLVPVAVDAQVVAALVAVHAVALLVGHRHRLPERAPEPSPPTSGPAPEAD
jgi:hypothetical protein